MCKRRKKDETEESLKIKRGREREGEQPFQSNSGDYRRRRDREVGEPRKKKTRKSQKNDRD